MWRETSLARVGRSSDGAISFFRPGESNSKTCGSPIMTAATSFGPVLCLCEQRWITDSALRHGRFEPAIDELSRDRHPVVLQDTGGSPIPNAKKHQQFSAI